MVVQGRTHHLFSSFFFYFGGGDLQLTIVECKLSFQQFLIVVKFVRIDFFSSKI